MGDEQNSDLVQERTKEPGLSRLLVNWVGAYGERFRAMAELAFAETRLAVTTFMLMIFLTVLAAGALLFAWALLLLAIAQWPLAMGYSPIVAALILGGLHVLIALILWRKANALGQQMNFPETRRVLQSAAELSEESQENDSEPS